MGHVIRFVAALLLGVLAGAAGLYEGMATQVIPAPSGQRTCIFGHPNSDSGLIVELQGAEAWNVCDDLTNPIRSTPLIKDSFVLAGNSWSPREICHWTQYGLRWSVWIPSQLPENVAEATKLTSCGSDSSG